MLIALRDLSIGDGVVKRGERVSAGLQAQLPPGRIEKLKAVRSVEEVTDEQEIGRVLSDVLGRLERLEKPPRKRKAA